MAKPPITAADFQALWKSAVDDGYSRPFLENPEDSNFAVWQEGFVQLERVSTAIDVTTQALFIMPWSGQTNDSARGASRAVVDLTFSRTKRFEQCLILDQHTCIDEVTNDWGENGPEPVVTGRVYRLLEKLVFNPGEAGPFSVKAEAVKVGYGYNNPLPGTLNLIEQVGSKLSNSRARYIYAPGTTGDKMIADNSADTPVPDHVGQYLRFTGGINAGAIKRVIGFLPAKPSGNIGGILFFESLGIVEGWYSSVQKFSDGDNFVIVANGAMMGSGVIVKQTSNDGPLISFVLKSGVLSPAVNGETQLCGTSNGAVLQYTSVVLDPALEDDSDVSWEMMDWKTEFGLSVYNERSPVNGRSAMLDELGKERSVTRAFGEPDDVFAERVHTIADSISPNAIRRAGNRVLSPYGLKVTVREVGMEMLPGFYYDLDAYDYDFDENPQLRHRFMFDYTDMRAFFLVGVPALDWGDFGFAYDDHPMNAYDVDSSTMFFDGYPWRAAQIYLSVYEAISGVIAGGVGFDLYIDKRPDVSDTDSLSLT